MTTQIAQVNNPLIETLERLRVTSNLASADWHNLLDMSWSEYQDIKLNSKVLSARTIENLSKFFKLQPEQILNGTINFKDLTLEFERGQKEMPERYSQAAFGRQRTSITSLDFVENIGGWRLRHDAIKKLGVTESSMLDPFAAISMRFIIDLCSYMEKRQYQLRDFFNMGAYSFVSNKNSVLGKILSETQNTAAAYELFFSECMKLLQRNYFYNIKKETNNLIVVEYVTDPDVAAESGVRHLGSQHVCQIQAGFISTIPMYLGLPAAKITKSSCVHRGDPVCTLNIDISDSNKNGLRLPSEV